MRRESPADNLPDKIFPQKFCSFEKIWHTEDANYHKERWKNMFQMTKENAMNTLKNYSMLMSRVREVVDEIGFLDKEFDTLDINKTNFTEDSVHVVAYDGHYDIYDSISCKFPLEFLFESVEMHKDWYRKKCEAEENKKQAEKEEAEKEEELRLLKKLKSKYEIGASADDEYGE